MTGPLLPGTLAVDEVSLLTGFSRDAIYEHSGGEGGLPVLRLGRRVRWPTRPLLQALGLSETAAAELLGIVAEPDPMAPVMSSTTVESIDAGQGADGVVVPLDQASRAAR